ncbi:MAG: hypothetical protein NVS4B3_01340 [Gemmatimonadaceae bacterium]
MPEGLSRGSSGVTSSDATPHAEIRVLSVTQARQILARYHVGRIAYTTPDGVDIEPVQYVVDGDWIYGRTSPGAKLAALTLDPRCAFETDYVRDTFDWESAVAQGEFSVVDPDTTPPETYARVLALLRGMIPDTLAAGDPTPHRMVLFRIQIRAIRGRAARL